MMKTLLLTLAAAAVALPAPAAAKPSLKGEEKLARAVEGRIAGEPVDCIDMRRIVSTRIIDDTAIVYDAGRTLYVNRPRSGADSLDRWDVLVTKTHGGDLCRVDVVELWDATSQMPTGIVFLGDFVPYRRAKDVR